MNAFTRLQPTLLSVLRIVTAYLFFWHGTAKFFGFPVSMGEAPALMSMYGIAGMLEIGGGLLLLLGLFTRPVAFLLSGQMAFAYFIGHASHNPLMPLVNEGESAVLFCFIFLYLAAAGAGPLSIDHLRRKA